MFSAEDFITELIKTWPDLEKKQCEQKIKDIIDYIKPLSSETRGGLLGAVKDYYTTKGRPPERADLISCADKARISIKKDQAEWIYAVCQVCRTKYPLHSPGCPVCRKKTLIKVGIKKHRPDGYVACHEDCYLCKYFGEKALGVTCKDWGRSAENSMCEGCICKKCCQEKALLRTNKDEYQRRMKEGLLEDRRYVRGR